MEATEDRFRYRGATFQRRNCVLLLLQRILRVSCSLRSVRHYTKE